MLHQLQIYSNKIKADFYTNSQQTTGSIDQTAIQLIDSSVESINRLQWGEDGNKCEEKLDKKRVRYDSY